MNNQTINMDSIIKIINELQIQNKQLIDENNNLKSIINTNSISQNNNISSNIDTITRNLNNYSFNTSETNLLLNNNLEDEKNSEHENLETKSVQDNLEKNN